MSLPLDLVGLVEASRDGPPSLSPCEEELALKSSR